MGGQGIPWDLDLIEYLLQLRGNLTHIWGKVWIYFSFIVEIIVCYERKMKGDGGVANTDRISLSENLLLIWTNKLDQPDSDSQHWPVFTHKHRNSSVKCCHFPEILVLVWSVVGGGNQCLESMANTIKANKPET